MTETYIQRFDNEWVDKTGPHFVGCCDCGLVHEVEFRIITGFDNEDRVIGQCRRDNKRTAVMRRSLKARKEGVFAKKKRQ